MSAKIAFEVTQMICCPIFFLWSLDRDGINYHSTSFLFSTFPAYPQILNEMILQEIFIGNTSLIASEVDRGRPIASIHWLRVTYDNESEVNISEITPTDFPRFTIVEDGLRISNTQMSDEGIYRIFMHNILRTIYLDILAAFEGMSSEIYRYIFCEIESHCKFKGRCPLALHNYIYNVT